MIEMICLKVLMVRYNLLFIHFHFEQEHITTHKKVNLNEHLFFGHENVHNLTNKTKQIKYQVDILKFLIYAFVVMEKGKKSCMCFILI